MEQSGIDYSSGVWLGSKDIGGIDQFYWVQGNIPTNDGSMYLPGEPGHSYGDCLVNYWHNSGYESGYGGYDYGHGLYVEDCITYTAPFVCEIF